MITLSKTDRALLAAKILCNGLIAVAAAAIAVFLASSAAGCFILGHSGALW